MGCCGQQRETLSRFLTGEGDDSTGVRIAFNQGNAVTVRGPVTGQAYRFDAGDSLAVDQSDAGLLVKSGYFRRA